MKIAPCPFCGEQPEAIDTGVSHIDVINLRCVNIDCSVNPETHTDQSLTQAVEAWNWRY